LEFVYFAKPNQTIIMSQKVLLTAKEVTIILHRLACQLIEKHLDFSDTILVGIQPRVFFFADV
jgi:pyrimidine operon attenuation protein/uracil phosphoribosyltransferase